MFKDKVVMVNKKYIYEYKLKKIGLDSNFKSFILMSFLIQFLYIHLFKLQYTNLYHL